MMVAQSSLQRGDELLMGHASRGGRSPASTLGSLSPATITLKIRRPQRPKISEMTGVSLMLASSSVA